MSKKKKTVQKNEPWAPAQPYILKGLEQSGRVFDYQQPNLDRFSQMQMDTYGRLAPGSEAGISGAQGLVNSTLAGDYLNSNPYLDSILAKTRDNVTDQVNSQFSSAGRYGSGQHAGLLASEIADAENRARYANYSDERTRQQQAIEQAQSLMNGSQGLLNNAAELPWIGVGALNGNVRQASSGYGTQTSKQSGGFGNILGGALGAGLSGWASGGF